jgi:Micrococcal nuclease (thermonuclease) homologs
MRHKAAIVLLLLFIIPVLSFGWEGKVVGVLDGDTITVLNNDTPVKIRLYGIDCPENKQAFGQRAKHFTSEKVFGKIVKVEPVDTDRYGRTVGLVIYDNGESLSERLVDSGYAWVYARYCKKAQCERWIEIERQAKEAKRGLWKDVSPVPPWTWRRAKRIKQPIIKGDIK